MKTRLRGALAMAAGLQDRVFDTTAREELVQLLDIDLEHTWQHPDDVDHDVDVLVTGWGVPRLTPAVLAKLPSLGLIAHAAGSVRTFVDQPVFDAGVRVTTAADANARPVAEYTLAMILLAGKSVPFIARDYAAQGQEFATARSYPDMGLIGHTVGIIGASRIGRLVIELLRPFDLPVVIYDPYLPADQAVRLGVRKVELDELLSTSQIVSIHAPDIPETRSMIGREQLAAMRDGSTLINTARQALVDHDALLAELRTGRIRAILDVTEPEPLPAGHPLFSLPNAVVTPHVAGSLGRELWLLGRAAVAEVRAYVEGGPGLSVITPEMFRNMA